MSSVTSSSRLKPRVAIIGITGYASFHLALLRADAAAGRIELRAATVINRPEAEQTCRELEQAGCAIYADYRAMLAAEAGRLDLCLIPTAPQWHAAMTVDALEAGCHVLLEKPLAPTLAEIEAIQAAERRTGRWVVVGFQDLHAPQLRALRRRLAAGEWGAIRSTSASCFWPRPLAYYSRNRWAGRLVVDGRTVLDSPVSNAMAHFAMLSLHLSAPPGRDAADLTLTAADLRRANAIESFDTFAIAGHTAEGVAFRFVGSHASPTETTPEVVLLADKARIVWRQWDRITITPAEGPVEDIPLPGDAIRRQLIDAVLDRLAGRPVFTCSTAAAAAHARLYISLHEAFPIRDETPARVRRGTRSGQDFVWIDGVEEELLASAGPSAAGANIGAGLPG